MRGVLFAAFLVLAGSIGSLAANSFQLEAAATGTIVLWFQGPDVTADIHASATLTGTLVLEGISTPFSVVARASGSGKGNTSTLALDAWVALRADGKTESGSSISIQGGISIDALDPTTTSTSGKGTGRFYLLIATEGKQWVVEGDATGNASGSFVVPDDPLSMQVEGTGTFSLTGEPHSWTPTGSAALPDWPASLLSELQRLSAALAAETPAK